MIKFCLTVIACILIQLFAAAQSKTIDERCERLEEEWWQVGGHLNISYDGERLSFVLLAQAPDTNSFVKKVIKEKNNKSWFSFNIGKMKIGEQEVQISSSSDRITYEVHDHLVNFKVYSNDIPCVVDGSQLFDMLMVNFSPDSAVFVCIGKESVEKVYPQPLSFTGKQVTWSSTDTNLEMRQCEYVVYVQSSAKGAFGFSRLSLREMNEKMSFRWDNVAKYLLTLTSFWFLWYLLVAGRTWFNRVDDKMVNLVIKWLPWLAGFYFVIIFDCIVSACEANATFKWRLGLIIFSVLLLIVALFWRRNVVTPAVLLCRSLCRTFSFSMSVFVLLGAIIQLADKYWGKANPFSDISGHLRMEVSAPYAVVAIVICYLYIAFVFFKLFGFNRIVQIIALVLTLGFAPMEPYRIMGDAVAEKFDCGISFSYPIKKIGETDSGMLDLTLSFLNQADMFSYIPLLLGIYLMVRLARRKEEQKTTVVMASLFTVFYCCYLTTITETFLLLPVTLLTAIWLSRLIIVHDNRARLKLIETGKRLYQHEQTDINVFKKMPELRQSVKLKELYRQRMLNGEMMPGDYEKAIADLDKIVNKPGTEIIRRRMEFGPYQNALRNGRCGLINGFLVAGVVYFIYFKLYLIEPHYTARGIPFALEGENTKKFIQHMSPVIFHSLAGFCLGYFFQFLRGSTGWEKGAWLGTAIGLAHLPIIYFTVENVGWTPLAGIFFKHVIILMVTGFLAFDLAIIRNIYGKRHSWKQVVEIMGWKSTMAFISVVLSAVGLGISSWISGHVEEVLKLLLGGS